MRTSAFTTAPEFWICSLWYCTQFSTNTVHTVLPLQKCRFMYKHLCTLQALLFSCGGCGSKEQRAKSQGSPDLHYQIWGNLLSGSLSKFWCQWFVVQNSPRVQFALQCLTAVEFPHSPWTLRLYMILLPTRHWAVTILGRLLSPDPSRSPLHPGWAALALCFPSLPTHWLEELLLASEVKSHEPRAWGRALQDAFPDPPKVSGELYNHPKLSLT